MKPCRSGIALATSQATVQSFLATSFPDARWRGNDQLSATARSNCGSGSRFCLLVVEAGQQEWTLLAVNGTRS